MTLFALALMAAASPKHISPITAGDIKKEAMSIGLDCLDSIHQCSGEWRGIRYTANADKVFTISVDNNSFTWSGACQYDKVEGYFKCHIGTSDLRFSIWKVGDGPPAFVWGVNAYPGSQLIAKVGNNPPLRYMSGKDLTFPQNALLFKLMATSPNATFRWSDWPDDTTQDVDVNLTDFSKVEVLFEAISSVIGHSQGE